MTDYQRRNSVITHNTINHFWAIKISQTESSPRWLTYRAELGSCLNVLGLSQMTDCRSSWHVEHTIKFAQWCILPESNWTVMMAGRVHPCWAEACLDWWGSSIKFETQTRPNWSPLLSLIFYEMNRNSYPGDQAHLLLAQCDFITCLTWPHPHKCDLRFMAHTTEKIILSASVPHRLTRQGPESMVPPPPETVTHALSPKLIFCVYGIASTDDRIPGGPICWVFTVCQGLSYTFYRHYLILFSW